MPILQTRRLHGRMSPDEALRRLLDDSGWRAVRVGAAAYRIERDPNWRRPPASPSARPPVKHAPPAPVAPRADIVVTGQKRPQLLQQVPMSLSVVAPDATNTGRVSLGSRDLALSVEGLALTNLGPGRNRQFIRGVADSPFNGPSQATVSIQLDETRITFDAPDPDIRLIDMQRIEILKGPQGPLYGSGALGGIYHLVTSKPDLAQPSGSIRFIGETIADGGPGAGGEVVINQPIVTDRLAIRAVGYRLSAGGWIDNVGRTGNANRTETLGGRMALRWQPAPDWTVDLSGIVQNVDSRDSQYVTSVDTLSRTARIAEPTDNDFRSAAATVQGGLGDLVLLATSSYVKHIVNYTLDATAGAGAFGLTGPATFTDDRTYTIVNHEMRLSPRGASHWLIGASYLRARSHDDAVVTGDTASVTAETLDRRVTEYALFGEATVPLVDRVKATLGARLFRTVAEDESVEQSGGAKDRISKTLLSPSVAIAWNRSDRTMVYLRYARALRPGGLAPAAEFPSRRFDSDELGTFDLGIRRTATGRGVAFGFSLFHTLWSHIQSDYLLANGLVSTRNAGRGRIYGIEANAEWRPVPRVRLSAGATYVNAMLTRTEDGARLDDRRLPITPNATARASARYDHPFGPWLASITAQANFIGSARLSFDQNLDRNMGEYTTVSMGGLLSRDRLTLGLRIDNLFDTRGDTFAFGNPFSIMAARQYTPLKPRTVTLSIARAW